MFTVRPASYVNIGGAAFAALFPRPQTLTTVLVQLRKVHPMTLRRWIVTDVELGKAFGRRLSVMLLAAVPVIVFAAATAPVEAAGAGAASAIAVGGTVPSLVHQARVNCRSYREGNHIVTIYCRDGFMCVAGDMCRPGPEMQRQALLAQERRMLEEQQRARERAAAAAAAAAAQQRNNQSSPTGPTTHDPRNIPSPQYGQPNVLGSAQTGTDNPKIVPTTPSGHLNGTKPNHDPRNIPGSQHLPGIEPGRGPSGSQTNQSTSVNSTSTTKTTTSSWSWFGWWSQPIGTPSEALPAAAPAAPERPEPVARPSQPPPRAEQPRPEPQRPAAQNPAPAPQRAAPAISPAPAPEPVTFQIPFGAFVGFGLIVAVIAIGLLLRSLKQLRRVRPNEPMHRNGVVVRPRLDPGEQSVTMFDQPAAGTAVTIRTLTGQPRLSITMG